MQGRATLAHRWFKAVRMSKSEKVSRADLDCLRLASDLTQLANHSLSPALKSYLLQMAQTCNELVDRPETRH
jgi:hypothetical protein